MLRRTMLLAAVAALALAGTAVAARPDFGADQWKPKKPGAAVQVGAVASVGDGFKAAEFQLKHEWPIVTPATQYSAYSFSVVGETDTGFFVRMGYIVLQSDGGGLARWFVQILDKSGKEKHWVLSRAGEANPPPASSCSSGDGTCEGYPFFVGSTKLDTWQFLFDGITKSNVRVKGSGSTISQVWFLGEVSHDGDLMGPRTALTTFRVLNGDGWQEPASASGYYSKVDTTACPYGVERRPEEDTTRANLQTYKATAAGTGIDCTTGALW